MMTYVPLLGCRSGCLPGIFSFHRICLLLLQVQEMVELRQSALVELMRCSLYRILHRVRIFKHLAKIPDVGINP